MQHGHPITAKIRDALADRLRLEALKRGVPIHVVITQALDEAIPLNRIAETPRRNGERVKS